MRITTNADLNLIPVLVCIDPIGDVWRLRWNIWNGSFEETEINHKPTLDEIKKIIIDWYNNEISNDIIYGFKWKGNKVCLSRENQLNYMMFCENDLFPLNLKFGDQDNPVYYSIETQEELKEFKLEISKHIKKCLQIGWSKKDNIDWSAYEKIINS